MYWAEFLQLEHARALAVYDHPFLGRWPAITRNQFGAGTLTYEGTFLSDTLQQAVVLDVLQESHVNRTRQVLPARVREKSGVNGAGKTLHYFLNYSSVEQTFTYDEGSGVDLLTGKTISNASRVQLQPWDVVIVREN